jgi:uncharacterized protein (DUF1501 family)
MRNRRQFIRDASLVSSSLWVPAFLQTPIIKKKAKSREGKILVVIQLSGGNDGLNTVVPFSNDIYYQNRSEIGIPASLVDKLSDSQGFHPALSPLSELYHQGEMTILNEVGYPNPDRSHFRSMDIWHTGSLAKDQWRTGWLGRYLDNACSKCQAPYHAIEIGDNLSLALHGGVRDGLAMLGPEKLQRATANVFLQNVGREYRTQPEDNLDFLYKTMIEVQQSAQYLTKKAKAHRSTFVYPNHSFGVGMKQISELIIAETNTQIYYISLPGFDTHFNQKARQAQLLTIYAQALSAFVRDLKSNNLFEDILIMTFSEFGRRVEENASQGTDHGAANNLILVGDKLKQPGFFNEAPDLITLDDGDLAYQVDFRSVYAEILEKWLETDALSVLNNVPRLSQSLFT